MKKFTKYITAILISSLLFSFAAYADTISDTPFGAGGTESSVMAPVQSESAAPAVGSAEANMNSGATELMAPGTSAAASSMAPGAGNGPAEAGTDTSAVANVETAKPVDGPVQTTNSSYTVVGPGVSGGAATSTGNSSASSTAGPGNGSVTGNAAPPVSTISSSNVPGADHAGDAVTKLDLGFTVVSPVHEFNGYKVAEGSVQLSDGSWATVEYGKYIKQPYFRLLREDGDWYVVAVNASRIGNYYVGSKVTELWLKKSDCVASNYIDINTTNPTRISIVKNAMNLLGKGYQYAGNGPDAYDCSGLVNAVMTDVGISIARTSSEICQAGTQVGIGGLRPGDIVGRPGHVGIYIGNGSFVHAAESSVGVIADDLSSYNSASSGFNSYVNVVGD